MIISRAPFRVSFFGGGTDYPVWFEEHGGSVLGTSINKYCYIMVRKLPPNFSNKYRIVYREEEFVNKIEDIKHPAVRECLKFLEIDKGLEIIHWADLPARKGMGTSSTFTVNLLNALNSRNASPLQLAKDAIEVEQERLRESVGCQDQCFAAIGGFLRIDFPELTYRTVANGELPKYLMLFDTGTSRIASHVAREQITETPNRKPELKAMQDMVPEAVELLEKNDYIGFGRLLGEEWLLKRKLTNKTSTPEIDAIYEAGIKAGAIGGKLLGAGKGGYMLFFAEPDKQDSVRKALELPEVKFEFESKGAQIIYNGHRNNQSQPK